MPIYENKYGKFKFLGGFKMSFLDDIFSSCESDNDDKWEFYKDTNSKWRWRRVSTNGRIVGSSSQGYVNKQDCKDNAKRHGYKGN
jgi:uncharacterized protein YegP (UPF0339 family)